MKLSQSSLRDTNALIQFSRPSMGYDAEGKLYYPNQLRREKFGNGLGVRIEESAENLGVFDAELSDYTSRGQVSAGQGVFSQFGLRNGVYFADNSVDRYAYQRDLCVLNETYTLSVFVRMDDGSAPRPGPSLDATMDCSLVIGGKIPLAQTAKHVVDDIYMIRATALVDAQMANNTGCVKYATQSAKGFTVGGLNLTQTSYPLTFANPKRSAEVLTIPTSAHWTKVPWATEPTNLLSENQADVEQDTSGFTSKAGATITRDTTTAWHGLASLKVITAGNYGYEGAYAGGRSAKAGSTVIGSVYVKGSGNIQVMIRDEQNNLNISPTQITLTDTWTRYVTQPYTLSADSSNIQLRVETTNLVQATTFYADGLMLSTSDDTSWVPGQHYRLLSPAKGQIDMWVDVNEASKRQVAGSWSRIFNAYNKRGGYGITLWHEPAMAAWRLLFGNEFGVTSYVAADTQNGKTLFTAKWDASSVGLCINGASVAQFNPTFRPDFLSQLFLGSSDAKTSFINTLFGPIRFRSEPKTDIDSLAEYQSGKLTRDDKTTFFTDWYDIETAARKRVVL